MSYSIEQHGRQRGRADVTVAVSLYNYGRYVRDALDSVAAQTLRRLSLIVVDDASRDGGPVLASRWMRAHGARFVQASLVLRQTNAGLAAARNLAVDLVQTPLLFVLDADNSIYPRCLERLSAALATEPAASMAYCIIEVFGNERGLMGTPVWSQDRLADGNYIDAMTMLRTDVVRRLGGYASMRVPGWEDYDLWCRFAETGLHGVRVPEVLARYRVHGASMLNTDTRRRDRAALLIAEMRERHPWLRISLDRH